MFWNRKPKEINPYVKLHELKLRNDKLYDDYLRWCYSVGEIAMDKYDFIQEITDREKQLNNLVK